MKALVSHYLFMPDDSLSSLVKDDRSLFEEQHNVCNFSAENDSHGVSPHLHIDCTDPLKHSSATLPFLS